MTDDEIQVGTISDAGFAGRPGLNQELLDASQVFVDWCNAAGGINGRTITMVERDAKLTEYKQRITESCLEDFMLVGGGGVFDDTGQAERIDCMLPEIPPFQVSPQSRSSDLIVNPVPSPVDELQAGGLNYLAQAFPDSTDKVGFLTGSVPSTIFIDAQLQDGAADLGWTTVYQAQYNPNGETSWTPFAQALKSAGVRGLVYTGEPENLAALLQAIADIDYELDWTLGSANALDQGFIDVGGDAVAGLYVLTIVVPPFLADENPATQHYLDLFEEYLPDGKSEAILGYNSFSAWLLFATAVGECGSDVTRTCVFEAAKEITEWTGGGLHGQTDPGANKLSPCDLVVEATPEGFVTPDNFKPTDGLFDCSPDNVIPLKGDYGTGVTLESAGKTMADLE
ncbi:MAG: ABC transporter substrate-binding protein [Candidatus Microthrix subdominans]